MTFDWMAWAVHALPRTEAGYRSFLLASSAICVAVMLPTTFFAGMTLPLITRVLLGDKQGESTVGAVYAANTCGAILGVFVAIHIGLPLLGLKGLITLGGGVDLALGVALSWSAAAALGIRWRLMAVVASAVAVGLVLQLVNLDARKLASGVYRVGQILDGVSERVVFHQDGKTATVSLVADDYGHLRIETNGKTDASMTLDPALPPTGDEATMILSGAVPMALLPQARTVAVIGLGCGLTTATLLANSSLGRVDTVEIEQKIVNAAAHFRPRVDRVYTDPRSHIIVEDAKTFFSSRGERYDIIVSEPSNPWVSGVSSLFSLEFYRLVGRNLSERGLLMQWFQLYEIDLDLVLSVFRAIDSTFDDYAIFVGRHGDALVVAKPHGQLPPIAPGWFSDRGLVQGLERIGVRNGRDLGFRKVATRRLLHAFVQSYPVSPNSDYYPVLDEGAARARFMRRDASHLAEFARTPIPALALLEGVRGEAPPTDVTPSPSLPLAGAAVQAMAIRDHLRDGRPLAPDVPTPPLREQVEVLRRWIKDCVRIADEPRSIDSLVDVSVNLIPFLNPREMGDILREIDGGHCTATVSQAERPWVALVSAMSARDGKRLAAAAHTLLNAGLDMPPRAVGFLVSAGMLGHLIEGEPELARELWVSHGPAAAGVDPDQELLLRVLAAESAAAYSSHTKR
jgi:hypothetical protein